MTLLFRISKGGVEPADVGEVAVPGEVDNQCDGPGVDGGVNNGFAVLLGELFFFQTRVLECKDASDDCRDRKDGYDDD